MNEKEITLLISFLDDYRNVLSNNGCNDWEFPESWTSEEKIELVKEAYMANGDPENFDPNDPFCMNISDFSDYFAVMALQHKLLQLNKG